MKVILDSCVDHLGDAIARFPWEDRPAYGDWLAQTYYYVRHSTRLLAAAAARFAFDPGGDALHHRFAAHMGEEKKHEQLAVHDIKRIGLALEDLPEHASTRMFYEPQYYKIEHESPLCLFGYILLLESIGPKSGKRTIERVTDAYGGKCASFLMLHTEEDVAHVHKAIEMVSSVPSRERRFIEQNIEQTAHAYRTMLLEIADGAARRLSSSSSSIPMARSSVAPAA